MGVVIAATTHVTHNSNPFDLDSVYYYYYKASKSDRTGQQVLQMFRIHAYLFAHSQQIRHAQPNLKANQAALYGGGWRKAHSATSKHDMTCHEITGRMGDLGMP